MSPGKHHRVHAAGINKKREKRSKYSVTKEGKRNRRKRKETKFRNEAASEIREGPTYESNIALADAPSEEDIIMIPAPIVAPDATKGAGTILVSKQKESHEVIFDLETTGRGHDAEIIQIAAKAGNETFSAYITPCQHYIPSHITDLTGISMRDRNMFHKGKKVKVFQQKMPSQGLWTSCHKIPFLLGTTPIYLTRLYC